MIRSRVNFLKAAFSLKYYKEPLDLRSTESQSFKNSDLTISKTTAPKTLPPTTQKDLLFGDKSTDHMLEVEWEKSKGWGKPRIVPFQDLKIHPFCSALHYAIQCFEGLKAIKGEDGKIRMFRPECNMYRLKQSTKSLCLPDFDGKQLLEGIKKLVKLQERWIPQERGFGLYIRPLHMSTESTLGVKEPTSSKLLTMVNPVGPYYESGFEPVRLLTETTRIRSAPGGYGLYKMGSNYGPTMLAGKNAKKQNFSQCLWLFDDQIVEIGSSNIFFVIQGKDGVKELHTPWLDDGLILPGITRDSVLELTRNKPGYRVVERKIMIQEIIQAIEQNRLLEMFATGTAVIVSPIKELGYKGKIYRVPIVPQKKAGDLAYQLFNNIIDIQRGTLKPPGNWIVQI